MQIEQRTKSHQLVSSSSSSPSSLSPSLQLTLEAAAAQLTSTAGVWPYLIHSDTYHLEAGLAPANITQSGLGEIPGQQDS